MISTNSGGAIPTQGKVNPVDTKSYVYRHPQQPHEPNSNSFWKAKDLQSEYDSKQREK